MNKRQIQNSFQHSAWTFRLHDIGEENQPESSYQSKHGRKTWAQTVHKTYEEHILDRETFEKGFVVTLNDADQTTKQEDIDPIPINEHNLTNETNPNCMAADSLVVNFDQIETLHDITIHDIDSDELMEQETVSVPLLFLKYFQIMEKKFDGSMLAKCKMCMSSGNNRAYKGANNSTSNYVSLLRVSEWNRIII